MKGDVRVEEHDCPSSFGYNALNQRVTRVENEVITHFYYTGGALLFSTENEYLLKTQNILDPSGGIVASKRFEGQEQTGQDPFANEYFFYRYDIRGSVTSIVDGTGARIKGYDYDEFGNATASSSAFHNDVTFTGSVSDASGLLYMNARYYNPQTARFLSQDTYKGVASSPWTQHLYSYCNNNPVNMIDPTGHKALPCLKDFWEWLTGGGNCGGKEAPTPEPSSTPKPITIEVTVAPSTPGPTPKPAPKTPQQKFIDFLEERYNNSDIFVLGAYGEYSDKIESPYRAKISESWLRKKYENKSVEDMETALASYARRSNRSGSFRAFDCSGLGSCWLVQNGYYSTKKNARSMYADTKSKNLADVKKGDWVFRRSGKDIVHIGYVVDDDLNVIEAKGAAFGVIKSPLADGEWTDAGDPSDLFARIP